MHIKYKWEEGETSQRFKNFKIVLLFKIALLTVLQHWIKCSASSATEKGILKKLFEVDIHAFC